MQSSAGRVTRVSVLSADSARHNRHETSHRRARVCFPILLSDVDADPDATPCLLQFRELYSKHLYSSLILYWTSQHWHNSLPRFVCSMYEYILYIYTVFACARRPLMINTQKLTSLAFGIRDGAVLNAADAPSASDAGAAIDERLAAEREHDKREVARWEQLRFKHALRCAVSTRALSFSLSHSQLAL